MKELEEAAEFQKELSLTILEDCDDDLAQAVSEAIKKAYIAGANYAIKNAWQKADGESITEDLGDYINELSKQFPEVSFAKLSRIAVRVANWQKEQMMAKAVDGVVHRFDECRVASVHYNDPNGVPMAYFIPSEGLSAGDKVKIITIKKK